MGLISAKLLRGRKRTTVFLFMGELHGFLSTKIERNKYVVLNDGEKQQFFGSSTKPGNLAVSRELHMLFSEKVCDSTS